MLLIGEGCNGMEMFQGVKKKIEIRWLEVGLDIVFELFRCQFPYLREV